VVMGHSVPAFRQRIGADAAQGREPALD